MEKSIESIVKLLIDNKYNIKTKQLIEKTVEIITDELQLQNYVKKLSIMPISHEEGLALVGAYFYETKELEIYEITLFLEYISNYIFNITKLNSEERKILKPIITLLVTIHELIHAKQEKESNTVKPTLPNTIYKNYKKVFINSYMRDKEVYNKNVNQMILNIMLRVYDYSPIEREANLVSLQIVLKILERIKSSKYLEDLLTKDLERKSYREYNILSMMEMPLSPTIYYFKNIGWTDKEICDTFDWAQGNPELDLNYRLLYGLPITQEELDKKLIPKNSIYN